MTTEQIFVYGTLRPPRENIPPADTYYHSCIAENVQNCCSAFLPNAILYDLGEYPGMRPGSASDVASHLPPVQGELLTVNEAALPITDEIEEHPKMYTRQRAMVETEDGPVEAWVYWIAEAQIADPPIIPSGDWFERADALLRGHIERLSQEKCSWLSTVRPDGRAHLSPMWHVWYRGRVYINTPATSVKVANIAQNPSVSISHPNPSNVVLIEGQAAETNELQAALKPLFQAKYDWDITTDNEYNTVVEITPLKLMAWNNGPSQRWGSAEILQVW